MLPSLLSYRNKKKLFQKKADGKTQVQDASLKNYSGALSEEKEIARVIGNTYVINQPRDIVGGYGYWSSIKQENPSWQYLTVWGMADWPLS